jgi:hypothetical protein
MNAAVERTEKELASLKSELAAKLKQAQAESPSHDTDESDSDEVQNALEHEVETLKAQQEQELEQIRQNHALHIKALKETFEKSIQEAEKWAESHAITVKIERNVQLEQAKKQYEDLRASKADSRFSTTVSRDKAYQQSRGLSIQNGERIRRLEAQISEISAATREESRDVKTKISECLAAIELRQREHELQIATLENEATICQTKYEQHLKQIEQQYAAERKRVTQAVVSEKAKLENLRKLTQQVEVTQKRSIQMGQQDIQKLKGIVSQCKSGTVKGLDHTRDSVSQTGRYARRCREVQQEIGMDNQEIQELEDENAELRVMLTKLDDSVYRRSG